MSHSLSFTTILALALTAGCFGTGDTLGNGGSPGQTSESNFLCEASLQLSGQRQSDGQGVGSENCVPTGQWVITAQVVDPGNCGNQIAVAPQYSYLVTGNEETDWQVQHQEGGDDHFDGRIVVEGGGKCNGKFLHYSQGGLAEVELSPFEAAPGILAGRGAFRMLAEPGF